MTSDQEPGPEILFPVFQIDLECLRKFLGSRQAPARKRALVKHLEKVGIWQVSCRDDPKRYVLDRLRQDPSRPPDSSWDALLDAVEQGYVCLVPKHGWNSRSGVKVEVCKWEEKLSEPFRSTLVAERRDLDRAADAMNCALAAHDRIVLIDRYAYKPEALKAMADLVAHAKKLRIVDVYVGEGKVYEDEVYVDEGGDRVERVWRRAANKLRSRVDESCRLGVHRLTGFQQICHDRFLAFLNNAAPETMVHAVSLGYGILGLSRQKKPRRHVLSRIHPATFAKVKTRLDECRDWECAVGKLGDRAPSSECRWHVGGDPS